MTTHPAHPTRAEISFDRDLVMRDNMWGVEGSYRLDGGEWHWFIFSRHRDPSEMTVDTSAGSMSGVSGIRVEMPKALTLNKNFVLSLLSETLGVSEWIEVRGPDPTRLRYMGGPPCPRAQISYDVVMEDRMAFVEGTYRLPGRDWQVFTFSSSECPTPKVIANARWESGITGVHVEWPSQLRLNKQAVVRVLSDALGTSEWDEVRGPDSIRLR